MKQIILGTAGHIDHGKTSLVKAMTGIDTDRLKEEKERGITLQDITAWVDFTAVAEAAEAAGLELAGHTTQAHFLIGNGIGEFVAGVADLDVVQRVNLSRQAMVLTLPGEMGERFKAIALAKGYDSPLRGFSIRDLRHTL